MKVVSRLSAFFAIATLSTISFCGTSNADIVYSENADGLTAGSDTLEDSTDWNGSAADYGVLAGGGAFATNHFELTAPDSNFNFANWDDGNVRQVVTFSMDLVDLGTSTSGDAGVRLAMRRNGGGSAFTTVTASGTPDNTIVHYDVVINTSGASVLYEDGVSSIADGTLQVWADGALVSSAIAGGSGDTFSVGLWNRRPDSAFLADNIEIRNTAFNSIAAIPEPASVSLIGLAVLGLAGIRRRSQVHA